MCCSTTPSTGQIGNECRQTEGQRDRELTAEESERGRKGRLEGKRTGKGKEKKGKEKKTDFTFPLIQFLIPQKETELRKFS